MKSLIVSLALALTGLGQAHAAVMDFNFSYSFESGETVSGVFTGDLQADNDTILISAISTSSYSGAPLVFPTLLLDDLNTAGPDQNFASLSGANDSFFGIAATTYTGRPSWQLGFFTTGGVVRLAGVSSPIGPIAVENFDPTSLSIAAVPAPAGAWLLATGLAGLGLRKWTGRGASA